MPPARCPPRSWPPGRPPSPGPGSPAPTWCSTQAPARAACRPLGGLVRRPGGARRALARLRDEARAAGVIPGRTYVGAWAEALPFRAGSADLAWLSTVIHQCDDRSAALAELRRVVRPDGRVLVRATSGTWRRPACSRTSPAPSARRDLGPPRRSRPCSRQRASPSPASTTWSSRGGPRWPTGSTRCDPRHVDSPLLLHDDEIAEASARSPTPTGPRRPPPHDTTIRLLVRRLMADALNYTTAAGPTLLTGAW